MLSNLTKNEKASLQARLSKNIVMPNNIFVDCWGYNSTPNDSGYHRVYVTHARTGKYHYVHRIMYTFTYGDLPAGTIVGHKCNRGSEGCCSPYHLEAVTPQQNVDTMMVSGRHKHGHIRPKLTAAQSKEIYNKKMAGSTQKELAVEYKRTTRQIRNIVSKIAKQVAVENM